jgi:hypothetical protein
VVWRCVRVRVAFFFFSKITMLLYRDVISKDEMFTDAFKIHEVDDMCIEVDCQVNYP